MFLGEIIIWCVYGETIFCSFRDKIALPFAHYLALPAHHSVFVYRKCFVGNHEIFIDSGHFAETFANRACSNGIVEIKHQVARLLKCNAIGFKSFGECEGLSGAVALPYHYDALVVTFEKSSLQRVVDAHIIFFGSAYREAVDEQAVVVDFMTLAVVKQIGNLHKLAIVFEARISAFKQNVEMSAEVAPFGHNNIGENGKTSANGVAVDGINHIVGSMLLHHLPRHGRESLAHASKEHAQVVVDFGRSAHSASRIASGDLLLYSNGWRQSFDEIAFRFGHSAKKLACIRRKALYIATLTFGIKCVEGKRRFA